MLQVKNISKKLSGKEILSNITLSLAGHEVVALVGQNGAGKTTLFNIIAGNLEQDTGIIHGNESIGYLPQVFNFRDKTVEEYLFSNIKITRSEYEMQKVFHQLGIADISLSQKANALSGGQKTKLHLASILLRDPIPAILLLDEPTNNLDLEGLVWLEEFVNNFQGAIFLTSHDRAFLDAVADRVIALENATIKSYGGNYSFYRQQKLEEEKLALKKYEENDAEVKRLEKLIQEKAVRAREIAKDKGREHEKFEKGFFADRASKKASNDKNAFLQRLARIEKLEKPESRAYYPFAFSGETPSTKFIAGVSNVSKRFDSLNVLDSVSLSLTGSEHVWLTGSNGSGKTTLAKIILGIGKADYGKVEVGAGVTIGYFSQEEVSGSDKTALEELQKYGVNVTDAYKYAKTLHFSPEDMTKSTCTLSRGQLTKLQFIKLLMQRNLLLILDEPTNHLEVDTREEIEEALRCYEGAMLIISHDRYFIDSIGVDKVYKLKNGLLEQQMLP